MTSRQPRRLLISAMPACTCDECQTGALAHQYLDAHDCAAGHYGWLVANQRAWPAAKPTADLVARSFGITADARGAVLAAPLISTTANELSLALAWTLALRGCPERESPEILAAWAPNADLAAPEAALAEVVRALFAIGSPEHAENLYPTD